MRNQAVRSFILALLIVVGIGSAYFLWTRHNQSITAADRHRDLNATLDRALVDIATVGTAQQAYVAPGQAPGAWMQRVPALMQGLYDGTAAMREYVTSADSLAQLDATRDALDRLLAADSRVREYLRVGEDLMAADLVFNEARETVTALETSLGAVRTIEALSARDSSAARDLQQTVTLSTAAAIWLIGVLMLFPASTKALADTAPLADTAAERDGPAEAAPEPSRVIERSAIDLATSDLTQAAAVCAEIARVSDGAALAPLLARVAETLKASGAILWMGAGQQLFAVASHGYDPKILARIGPIARAAENATAAAWRTGELRTVTGDGVTGAIVAPLVGPEGCRGVLAIEVHNGRAADPQTRAVASVIAAQLTGLVGAWPAASGEKPVKQAM